MQVMPHGDVEDIRAVGLQQFVIVSAAPDNARNPIEPFKSSRVDVTHMRKFRDNRVVGECHPATAGSSHLLAHEATPDDPHTYSLGPHGFPLPWSRASRLAASSTPRPS